jgi:hypothetical protein
MAGMSLWCCGSQSGHGRLQVLLQPLLEQSLVSLDWGVEGLDKEGRSIVIWFRANKIPQTVPGVLVLHLCMNAYEKHVC